MFENIECLKDVSLANFSTIKIGGKAKFIVFPKNTYELKSVLKEVEKNNLPYFVLGNGSNVLFDDLGFDGVIICMKRFDKIANYGESVRVGAGVNLFALNMKLKKLGLSGIEWSYGIPATVGGMLVMNGGCFGHDISQVVEEVLVLDKTKLKRLKKEEIQFSYRYSSLQKYIVLSAKFCLKTEKNDVILRNMNNFYNQKKLSQPCDKLSLGSVFKIVQGQEQIYPAKLIDNLGLKGVKIGGAEISKKHAGFIVNNGNATCQDVLNLIDFVEAKLAELKVFPEREIVILKNKK